MLLNFDLTTEIIVRSSVNSPPGVQADIHTYSSVSARALKHFQTIKTN